MKKKLLFTILLFQIFLTMKSNGKELDTICLSSDLTVYQEKTTNNNHFIWCLYLSNKNKSIKLEKMELIIDSNNHDFIMHAPSLIDAFEDKKNIYIFIYQNWKLYLYHYKFANDAISDRISYALISLPSGSVDNFGGYKLSLKKKNIKQDFYVYTNSRRSIGGAFNELFYFNTQKSKVYKIQFSEKSQVVKDKKEIFKNLNLEYENKSQVEKYIKEFLLDANKNQNIVYYDCLDITPFYNMQVRNAGTIYFFFNDSKDNKMKILQYNCFDNEWLVGDYEEIEIMPNKE